MELTKETVNDKIEILENGTVQVRQVTRILEDGVVVATSFHRRAISPIDNADDEGEDIKAVVALIQTDEVKKKYKDNLEAEIRKLERKNA